MGISIKNDSKIAKIVTLFFGNVLSLLVGMITAPIITRIVDTNEYGQVSFFTMYTNIFLLFTTLGLERAYIRYYYETHTEKRKKLLFDCVKTSLLFFVICIPLVLFLLSWADFKVNASKYIVYALFVINGFMLTLEKFTINNLRIQQKSMSYAISSILSKVIYGVLAVVLVLNFKKSEFLLLIASTTIASTCAFIFCMFADKKSWNFRGIKKIESQWNIKELLRFSLPLMIHGTIAIIFQSADKIMIKHFCDYSQVGIYASAGYYLTLCNVFVTAITTITGPEMYEYSAKNPKETKLFSLFNQMMSLIMFVLVFSIIFCKDILVLLLGEQYRGAGKVMPFLMIGIVMSAVSGINAISIEIKKKTVYNVLITGVSAIANIIGNYFLIPIFGIKGAAISTGCSYLVYFALTTIISKKLLNFDMSVLKFCSITVLLLIFAIYNTFCSFGWITVFLYVVSIASTMLLYRKSFIFIFDKLKGIIKKRA